MQADFGLIGPSLTPAFASQALPALLARLGLYPHEPTAGWRLVSRGLREFAGIGGPARVLHHIINPLATTLGYGEIRREDAVSTREGPEDGGYSLRTQAARLRVWPVGSGIDLET